MDVAKLLKKLKREHVSGLIVDLRYNPGGSLEEAIKFTGLFIKDGPVVQARNPGRPDPWWIPARIPISFMAARWW